MEKTREGKRHERKNRVVGFAELGNEKGSGPAMNFAGPPEWVLRRAC